MTTTPVRIDLAIASPVILLALRGALTEREVRVATAATTWVEFSRSWDFSSPAVVVDAHLDDHVPLPLKIRALRQEATRVAVLGRDGDGPQARRALADGAELWLTPDEDLATLAGRLATWAASESPPAPALPVQGPGLTDRELQVVCLYASRRGHPVREIATVLGLSPETVRTHLRTGRAKLSAAGRDVGTRAHLTQALVDDGLVEDPDLWRAMQRW